MALYGNHAGCGSRYGGCVISPGTVVYQIPDSDDAPALAREFCRTRKLTPEDAKIIRRNGMVMVEIKRPCLLKV